jgi:hypothetical protein
MVVSGAWVLLVFASCFWVFGIGPTFSWDWAHYHHYAGFQWLEKRLGHDILAASDQTFFNPMAYVPAYWLTQKGLSSLAVACSVAVWHALNLLGVALIAREVIRTPHGAVLWALPVCMVYAWLTPMFLNLLGTSSIDVSTSVGVLFGVACCLHGRRTGSWRAMALGGLAVGMAGGLKLSNAVVAPLMPVLWCWPSRRTIQIGAASRLRPPPWQALKYALAYGIGGVMGLAMVHGAWGLALYRLMGNPFYPFFQSLFAPRLAAESSAPFSMAQFLGDWLRSGGGRFVPTDWRDFLSFPFDLANPSATAPRIYAEWHAPDPRLLVLLAVGAFGVFSWLWRRRPGPRRSYVATIRPEVGDDAVGALWAFAMVWGMVWILTSANGRYGLPWLMMVSVLVVHGVWRAFAPGSARRALLMVLIGAQAFFAMVVSAGPLKVSDLTWARADQGSPVPAVLRAQPWLHLSVLAMSWSYFAPQVHRDSVWVNTVTVCEGCSNDVHQETVRRHLRAWAGRARVWVPYDEQQFGKPGLSASWQHFLNTKLAPFEVRMDPDDCVYFDFLPGLSTGTKMVEYQGSTRIVRPAQGLASCMLRHAPGARGAESRERRRHDTVFAAIEHVCGAELGPAITPTRWDGRDRWERMYTRRELRIVVQDQQIHLESMWHRQAWSSLDVWRGPGPYPDCTALQRMTRLVRREAFDGSDLSALGGIFREP